MRVHFTNLFGQSPRSVALIAQNDTMKIAKELGANELAIYFYDNSQESSGELNSRLDGIVAGVSYGDIVFFQSPSWNSVAWDTSLIHKFRAVQTKLVMFIHDVPPIMFPSNYFLMPNYIEMYNLCHVVVVPSEQMRDRLIEEGLTVKKIIIQELWDLPHNLDLHKPSFQKKLIFAGNPTRFPHILNWQQETPLHVYAEKEEDKDYSRIQLEGWRNKQELLFDLSKGGFGLVWGNSEKSEDELDYYKLNISYKLSTYLAAGLPVVVPDYLSNANYIREHGLGFVVSSLEEADRCVQECTEEQYAQMVANAQYTAYLISNGYFIKKLFIDAIMALG